MAEDYDETVDVKKARTFLILGDEFGHLKLWDLTGVIKKLRENGIRIQRQTWAQFRGDKFSPGRVEGIACDEFVAIGERRKAQRKMFRYPEVLNPILTKI